ncbi:MAG: hypothetical protein EP318_18165 [Rhodobacteraceae bacterium]|nr:MAG: hypothetical protein EP318_18165 [Paracoccaceae bacterium]
MTESRPDIAPLPRPDTASGAPRLVGVEIEIGGLPEVRVARVARDTLGGRLEQGDGPFWTLKDSEIGDLEIYLDIFIRKSEKSALRDAALTLGREVIPVEIVSPPLTRDGMRRLGDLIAPLRRAGALGSSAGVFFGFGIHFNIQTVSEEVADIRGPLTAFALIEDWLRAAHPIDETRRILPFTTPYPTGFVRALLSLDPAADLGQLIALYVGHNATRNRGLDMLPLFAHLAPERLPPALLASTARRPTFHFRLPDCRIDEPGWSLAQEWRRWVLVEQVASDPRLMRVLARVWQAAHGPLTLSRHTWAQRAGDILLGAGLAEEPVA